MQFINFINFNLFIFFLGSWGLLLNNKNIIIMLMAIEILLVSINLNFITFSIFIDDIIGHLFTLYILTVAAAEVSIGLAIIMVYFRNKGDIKVRLITALRI